MTKAGGSIQTFSESTHIEALTKACKMMKIKKKSYLYNSSVHPDSHGWSSAGEGAGDGAATEIFAV